MQKEEDTGDDEIVYASETWWLATIGNLLLWARLRVRESGIAEIMDSDGRTETYDSEDTAQTALLDADFRAFDGLDADDADQMGFDLDDVDPPHGVDGADDDELRVLMSRRLTPRQ